MALTFFAYAIGTVLGFYATEKLYRRISFRTIVLLGLFVGLFGGLIFLLGFFFGKLTFFMNQTKRRS